MSALNSFFSETHPGRLAAAIRALNQNPYVGSLGVFLGAGIATLNGRLISVGLPDLRGALGLGVDEASWIPTAYNMALMFMGPFSPNLGVLLALQVISGLASGTFYPLTLTYALRALPFSFVIYGIGVY